MITVEEAKQKMDGVVIPLATIFKFRHQLDQRLHTGLSHVLGIGSFEPTKPGITHHQGRIDAVEFLPTEGVTWVADAAKQAGIGRVHGLGIYDISSWHP